MNGDEFVRRMKKLGRATGISVRLVAHRSKGSHQTLYFGDRLTIVQSGEIPPGTLHAMLKQLGLTKRDL